MGQAGYSRTHVLYLITKSNLGGAQRYVYQLATMLPREQFTAAVGLGGTGELHTKLKEAGIRTAVLSYVHRDIGLLSELLAFWSILKLIRYERPDVLHVNSSKIGGLGALAGRLLGVQTIVFTAHGWAFNEQRSAPARTAIKFLYWLTISLSHTTIAVSANMARQVAGWPHVAQKITVIYNGIPQHDFYAKKGAREQILAEYNYLSRANESVWIGTLAELHPIKGLGSAITAIADLARRGYDARFFIWGEGELREQLTQRIRTCGAADRVFLLGYHPHAAQLLPAFDIFLLPSHSEALSYAILEAGDAGLPVVASHVGGIPEVITDGTDGTLVPPGDTAAIADALAGYIDAPELQGQHGAALRARVRRDFSLQQMVDNTVACYRGHAVQWKY